MHAVAGGMIRVTMEAPPQAPRRPWWPWVTMATIAAVIGAAALSGAPGPWRDLLSGLAGGLFAWAVMRVARWLQD